MACDLYVAVTATSQLLYVLVIVEHASRKLLHCNVANHPSAQWMLQQLREAIPLDHHYRYLIHDHDSIFSPGLDHSTGNLGLRVLKAPYRSPQGNALCERLIGSLRRECLDFLIPFSEKHLRRPLNRWREHDNRSRPHMALGPSLPEPSDAIPVPLLDTCHRSPDEQTLSWVSILNGLHHEHSLVARAA